MTVAGTGAGSAHATDKTGDVQRTLVSVVVAAFNAAEYIEETCLSVLHQTWRNLELIVVDDGSTDGTGAIVETLASTDARVRLLRQANRGVAAARNAGIDASSGEYLAVLDADDLWDPTKIERQVTRLEEVGPRTGFVYCWWVWIDVKGRVLDRSPRWRVEGPGLEKLVEINFTGNTSVPLFRRASVVDAGGYDETLRARGYQGSEDWDLALRIAEHEEIAVVPAVLVGYRRRGDGMSTACETMWRSHEVVMNALIGRRPSLPASVIQRSNGQYALYLAGVSFWSGRYGDACRWGLRARPFSVSLRVLPYLVRTFARRLVPAASRPAVMTGVTGVWDEPSLPEPLMPYDRIYSRLWRRADGRHERG
jgi:glycosyltransferase involved in cell wall biosynthesis